MLCVATAARQGINPGRHPYSWVPKDRREAEYRRRLVMGRWKRAPSSCILQGCLRPARRHRLWHPEHRHDAKMLWHGAERCNLLCCSCAAHHRVHNCEHASCQSCETSTSSSRQDGPSLPWPAVRMHTQVRSQKRRQRTMWGWMPSEPSWYRFRAQLSTKASGSTPACTRGASASSCTRLAGVRLACVHASMSAARH